MTTDIDEESSTNPVEVIQSNICGTVGCGKVAELACPTCIKLGIAPTRFCNQECFKSSWNDHRALHKKAKKNIENDKYLTDPTSLPSEFARRKPCISEHNHNSSILCSEYFWSKAPAVNSSACQYSSASNSKIFFAKFLWLQLGEIQSIKSIEWPDFLSINDALTRDAPKSTRIAFDIKFYFNL